MTERGVRRTVAVSMATVCACVAGAWGGWLSARGEPALAWAAVLAGLAYVGLAWLAEIWP